ncbi:MAG: single-stranded DNA-binding protein [Bacteroidales bacterium]|jgi:single-strand DNA-binding protein|nr:single-stranded DNA-binding protein [Bacteroidales bacterium]
MNLKNHVQLIGNLGTNPIVKEFENGKKVARFSIATNDVYKTNDTYTRNTQWHTIVCWDKVAEIAERCLSTGCEVVIDGSITNRSYNDKDGKKQIITEIIANSVLCRRINSNTKTTTQRA